MDRETLLKAVHFDSPDSIPVVFHINLSCWDHYPREELARLVESHPLLFPEGVSDFVTRGDPVPYPPWCSSTAPWTDPWGCVWETTVSGFIGTVTRHPLAGWKGFDFYAPPDPSVTTHWYPVDWERGSSPWGGSIGFFSCLKSGEIGHGHTFLKLIDMLGYEQTLFAMADGDPRLTRLLEMIESFNLGLTERFLEYTEAELLGYAEDLGMQTGPLISPELFSSHILPSYRRIMEPARRRGTVIHMHSDGDIKALADLLLTLPIQVLNIQDQVNGLPWIADTLKGSVAVDLDIDRQHITPVRPPGELQEYIREILRQLADPAGGLMLTYGLYPGTPLENVKALMDILESVAQGDAVWKN